MESLLLGWPQTYLLPLLAAIGLWAGLTAGLLALNRRGPRAGRRALILLLPVLALAHHQLWAGRDDLSRMGAYSAFLSGMLIWAWHELAFYSGVIGGPWNKPCPPQARGIGRFLYALGTHLYHELACLAEIILLVVVLHGARNQIGLLVFVFSWALQQSAKLNVLLGVRSLQVELFPPHLRYLGSYWAPRAPSAFFLPSVSVATLLALMLWLAAGAHVPDPAATRLALLAALLTLGALEHWLLILPAGFEVRSLKSEVFDPEP